MKVKCDFLKNLIISIITLKIAYKIFYSTIYYNRNYLISFLSVISIFSISISISMLIVGLSIINGFEKELHKRIFSIIPHAEIEFINPVLNWRDIIVQIEKIPGVIAVAPYVSLSGLIEKNGKLQAIQIKGIDLKKETNVSTLLNFIKHKTDFYYSKNQIILGKGIAENLNVKIGSWITIIAPNKHSLKSNVLRLQVSDILMLNSIIDNNMTIISLYDAQKLLNKGNNINGISIKVHNRFKINNILYIIGNKIRKSVYIYSWIDKCKYIYRDIKIMRIVMNISILFILSIACFNIFATLSTVIKNKKVDIAVLYTIGATPIFIRFIFIWYGILISIIGSIIGTILGILFTLNITNTIQKIETLLNYKFFSTDIYFINFIPTNLYYVDIFYILSIVFIISILSSIYASKNISLVKPSKVLRNI